MHRTHAAHKTLSIVADRAAAGARLTAVFAPPGGCGLEVPRTKLFVKLLGETVLRAGR